MENIIDTLRQLGITSLYKGYRQLAYLLSISMPHICHSTQKLYQMTATHFGCNTSQVERNVRTVIKHAWEVNPNFLCEMAGQPLEVPPSAARFIAILREYISNNQSSSPDGGDQRHPRNG